MIVIHPVHRRLAELYLIATKRPWNQTEVQEVHHCLQVNANLVRRLDELKNLAYIAHISGDMEWEQEICAKLDEMEAKLI